ncbi:MAG: hypothetical protein QXH60_02040 [Candidatus Pacearchaeota archaeon]
MEIKKKIYIIALCITLFLFTTVLFIGYVLDRLREDKINSMSVEVYNDINEMQTFMLMSEIYGNKMTCLAFKNRLKKIDKSTWDLGIKIDRYRVASEEFQKDPFYLEQKKAFNENEVYYLLLLSKIKKDCNYKQSIVLFFYKNSEECGKCDDQSFVLTDIKNSAKEEVSIFSFDADLNLTNIELLTNYYNITQYPCTVVDDKKYCGMQDKSFIVEQICKDNNITICQQQ